jgi:hypothetical protein
MTNDSITLLENEDFLALLSRSLVIRYMLAPGNSNGAVSFAVEILGATGESGNLPNIFFHFKNNTSLPDKFSPPLSGFRFAANAVLDHTQRVIAGWEMDAANQPEWTDWLQPKPFVGVLVFGERMKREVEANHQNFLMYHGALAQQMRQHADYQKDVFRKGAQMKEVRAFEVLAKRFCAFAGQIQLAQVRQTLGTVS